MRNGVRESEGELCGKKMFFAVPKKFARFRDRDQRKQTNYPIVVELKTNGRLLAAKRATGAAFGAQGFADPLAGDAHR